MQTIRTAPAAPRTSPSTPSRAAPLALALALLAPAVLAGCAATLEAPALDARIGVARVPASADDCKKGGWRDLRDAEGDRFRNQGECVSWVNAR